MEDESFGIRDAFKRELEQTNFLIRLVLGGGLVVAVFSTVTAVLLGSIVVLPAALILCLIYSMAVVFTTARLIFSAAGRRHMESALHSRTPTQVQEAAIVETHVAEQAWFREAYFMLRLREEVASARRDGREMTVLAIQATMPGVELSRQVAERVAKEIAEIASNHHKTISHTLSVNESEYVMSLPNLTVAEAKPFVSKLVQSLGDYWCHFGTAFYPKDATSADSLVSCARDSVEESRHGKSSRSQSDVVA